jgi:hypothetical protein
MGTPVYVASAYAGFGEKVGFEKKDPGTTLNLIHRLFLYLSKKLLSGFELMVKEAALWLLRYEQVWNP